MLIFAKTSILIFYDSQKQEEWTVPTYLCYSATYNSLPQVNELQWQLSLISGEGGGKLSQ